MTRTSKIEEALYTTFGVGFLALAKLKHLVAGYTTPKPYSMDDVERCIDYDIRIADRFLRHLEQLAGSSIDGKHVLELGPGSDLGVGLILLSRGAASYVGFDRHNLAGRTPRDFYTRLAARVPVDLSALEDGRVTYSVREDFDVARGVAPGIDLVLSNAAFEHFDDVAGTVKRLTEIVCDGGRIVAEIDLQTHSRWIKDIDPNNIYRYSKQVYRLFGFPGQPNRMRPDEYRRCFEINGWTDVSLTPQNRVRDGFGDRIVHPDFAGEQMDWLSFVLCASKSS